MRVDKYDTRIVHPHTFVIRVFYNKHLKIIPGYTYVHGYKCIFQIECIFLKLVIKGASIGNVNGNKKGL